MFDRPFIDPGITRTDAPQDIPRLEDILAGIKGSVGSTVKDIGEWYAQPSRDTSGIWDTLGELFRRGTRPGGPSGDFKWQDPEWSKPLMDVFGQTPLSPLAFGAKLPALTGMIKWGEKEYPQAFLHRSMRNVKEELPAIENLFNKGLTTEKPTTIVTPTVNNAFDNAPGLLFNTPHDIDISWRAYPRDVYSSATKQVELTPEFVDLMREYIPQMRKLDKYETIAVSLERGEEFRMPMGLQEFMRKLNSENVKPKQEALYDRMYNKIIPQYNDLVEEMVGKLPPDIWRFNRRLQDKGLVDSLNADKPFLGLNPWTRTFAFNDIMPTRAVQTETWAPRMNKTADAGFLFDNLDDFLKKAGKNLLRDMTTGNPGYPATEVFAPINKSNLAGVRLNADELNHPASKALSRFAKKEDLPVYLWRKPETGYQTSEALREYPLAGEWDFLGNRNGLKYYGSSEDQGLEALLNYLY